MKHLLNPTDLTVDEINELIQLAEKIQTNRLDYINACKGKTLATLFYEPSTRTRLSFTAAMYNMGGNVLGFTNEKDSSASKGETLEDTIRVVSSYADIVAIRHPKEGSATLASMYASIPIINAGDGGNQHPTQALTDLLTIHRLKGRLDHLTIGFCGDLKFGRTVHSLINALVRYQNIQIILISPEELRIPSDIRDNTLRSNDIDFIETTELEKFLPQLDILYMTRVQKERFFNEDEYIRLKDRYILDSEKMKFAKNDMIVMHPLPRVNEISNEIDSDPRAAYFKQTEYAVYMRKAIILKLLNEMSEC